MHYPQIHDGDLINPVMRGYRMRCCDCHLVHDVDFYVVKEGRGHGVRLRVKRNKRATAGYRRGMK